VFLQGTDIGLHSTKLSNISHLTQCGGELEHIHCSSANRRRWRKGNSAPGCKTCPPCQGDINTGPFPPGFELNARLTTLVSSYYGLAHISIPLFWSQEKPVSEYMSAQMKEPLQPSLPCLYLLSTLSVICLPLKTPHIIRNPRWCIVSLMIIP
jgi:hypothetical protein